MHLRLNFQVFIIVLLFILTKNIEIYSFTLIFIVVHELSHIITSLCLGFRIKKANIMPLGFSILLEKSILKISKYDRLIIAVAGPISNFIISILFIIIPLEGSIKEIIVYSNIVIAAINLIPIMPLDGGRILKEILEFSFSKIKTINILEKVTYIGVIVLTLISSILILFYNNIAIFIGIVFLWWIVIVEDRKNRYRKIAYSVIEKCKLSG